MGETTVTAGTIMHTAKISDRAMTGKRCRAYWLLAIGCWLALSLTGAALAQPAAPAWEKTLTWQAWPVGEAVGEGSHEWDAKTGVLTVAGGGKGVHIRGTDQLHFVGIDRQAGDVEILVRLTRLDGDEDAVAGIMLRNAADAPAAPMATVHYGLKNNAVTWAARVPAPLRLQTASRFVRLNETQRPASREPLWLRMVCVDGKFAVHKSRDGKFWSMITNVSGGQLGVTGPLRIGVFVAGGADKPATAVFDSINIGDPHLRYRTSMVGNTGGDMIDNHTSGNSASMWVSPDGTCYTSSYWDEVGYPVRAYRDGKPLDHLPLSMTENEDGGITGHGRRLFVAWTSHIVQLDLDAADKGFAPRPILLSKDMRVRGEGIYAGPAISGMATDGKELFVADQRDHLIRVVTLEPKADGEHAELLDRGFAFENPGTMAFDKRGHLWIAQRLVEGVEGKTGTQGAVKCYTTDGKFTGRQLPGVTNPTALAYDAVNDQLLVAEGLPDLNVRFYSNLDKAPALERTFGEKGGVYSGKTPGLIYDPAAGGYARFTSIRGLGVDETGNLYVTGGWQGTDLRSFAPDGTFRWHLYSLVFCNTYDFDPASDGTDLYGNHTHVRLDLNKTKPGTEQTYVGYNWDWRRFGTAPGRGGSQSILRRLGEDSRLIQYTSGQGDLVETRIFRHEGELTVPCGTINRNGTMWIDTNGDGKESPDEVSKLEGGSFHNTSLAVDSRGDIWMGLNGRDGSQVRRFIFKGLNEHGVPIYGHKKGDYEDTRIPGDTADAFGMNIRLDYDADRDIMIVQFPREKRNFEDRRSPRRYVLARFDNWSKGSREATWKIDCPTPLDPACSHYFMYDAGSWPDADFMGMQMVGDYVFFAFLFGEVFVYDLAAGELVDILTAGPEISGMLAWEDATMGLRAFKRKNGEYIILTENGGWAGRNNLFRWRPPQPPSTAPSVP